MFENFGSVLHLEKPSFTSITTFVKGPSQASHISPSLFGRIQSTLLVIVGKLLKRKGKYILSTIEASQFPADG